MTVLSHASWLPRYLNPVLLPAARRLPPLAIIHHRGRRTGRAYDTPVQVYRTKNGYLVGLAYDRDAQWACNLLASGQGQMTRTGQRYTISQPRRRGPDARQDHPAGVGPMMQLLGIDDFLEFDAVRDQ